MKRVLITGGTVFVSRYIAEYCAARGDDVYVLNRGTRQQSKGVTLIQADRFQLGDVLRRYSFDLVVDNAYNAEGIHSLLDALNPFGDYVFISSSAVYPEYETQPFREDTPLAENKYWRKYGTDKIAAEQALLQRVPTAYILRPPYLYGPMNNVYREAFVWDCALQDRVFYLPRDGSMPLQFLHIEDLCRFIDVLLAKRPQDHIFNVGNKDTVSIRQWVELCYQVAGKEPIFRDVYADIDQRQFFSFLDYPYVLDVSRQHTLMPDEKDLFQGLQESFAWYRDHGDQVNRKPYLQYIDSTLSNLCFRTISHALR